MPGKVLPIYKVGRETCSACEYWEKWQHTEQKKNQARIKSGEFVPQNAHIHRIYTVDEIHAIQARQAAEDQAAQQLARDYVAESLTQQSD